MTFSSDLPDQFLSLRESAMRAIAPVKSAESNTTADTDFLFSAERTSAGNNLPPYYLVYFLLVQLLNFKNLGRSEKVAWSVPIDLQGRTFLVEHRKLGIGVFAHDAEKEEGAAQQIVSRIRDGVKVAEPYFEWLAEQAVEVSAVNVINNSMPLFDRYVFLLEAYDAKTEEAERLKDEVIVEEGEAAGGQSWTSYSVPSYQLRIEASWLAISAIEAFFSWTEHAFIHLAILTGRITAAKDIAALAVSSWPDKFKAALVITDPDTKGLYDQLLSVRREVRNFVAHGAFGKQGEAFMFHSGAGAVPVLLPQRSGNRGFVFGDRLAFDAAAAIGVVRDFESYLWAGTRAQAGMYIQESGLPTVLTMAGDGTYLAAMDSSDSMEEFITFMNYQFDQAANMDW